MNNIIIDKIYGSNATFINNTSNIVNMNDCIFNKVIITENDGDVTITNLLVNYLYISNDYDGNTIEEFHIENAILDTIFVDKYYTI